MERTISATEARGRFGELMRRVVEAGESVIVERGGEPQVVVLSIAEYRRLRSSAEQGGENWQTLVDRSREQIRAELSGRELPPPEQIIQQDRDERDVQLVDLR